MRQLKIHQNLRGISFYKHVTLS